MEKLKRVLLLGIGISMVAGLSHAGVVGTFKFDKFNKTGFTDDGGFGLKGFLGRPYSDPTSTAGPSGITGDKALVLDGSSALVVDDSAGSVLNILTPPITLECWVRSSLKPSGHVGLISYGIPGGQEGKGGYKLGMNAGNLLFTLFGVVDVNSTVEFPFDNKWHHVAAVYSDVDKGVHYYLDGAEKQFVAENRNMIDPGNRELDLGAQYTALGRFNGAMDRARISKAALTLAELDSDVQYIKPVAANTVAYFSFDEDAVPYKSQGIAKSQAVSLATWVLTNPPVNSDGKPTIATDTPSGAAKDTSLQFNGTQMAVVNDPAGVLNFTAGDWTLEAWVKVDPKVAVNRMVFFYYGNPGHGYSLSFNIEENSVLQVTTLGIADLPSKTAVIPRNVWTHVAVVHKYGVSMSYFINGKEIETQPYANKANAAQTLKLYIGAEWNQGLPFTGFIDRIRLSSSALTPEQMDTNATVSGLDAPWELY